VPANVTALAASKPQGGGAFPGLTIVGPTGLVVPTTAAVAGSWTILTSSVPLDEGCDYSFHYPRSGPNGGDEIVPFHVAPAAPKPSSLGALTVAERTTRAGLYSGSSCWSWVPVDGVRLAIQPSPSLAPYLALVKWSVRVDGAPWRASSYGDYRDELMTPQLLGLDPTALHVFTQCTSTSNISDRGVTAGHHTIEITAALPGEELALAPMTIEVDLACPAGDAGAPTMPTPAELFAEPPPPPVAVDVDAGRAVVCVVPPPVEDAGTRDGSAESSADANLEQGDAANGDAGSGATPRETEGCSASLAPPRPLSGVAGGFAIIGITLMLRRRTRRRGRAL
jgi:hypothetical protein